MTASVKIAEQIAAAKALGAPLFGLDRLLIAAIALEAKIQEAREAALENGEGILAALSETEQTDDLAKIETASNSAFAFACCRHLPYEISSSYRDRKDINDLIIEGLKIAKKYIG